MEIPKDVVPKVCYPLSYTPIFFDFSCNLCHRATGRRRKTCEHSVAVAEEEYCMGYFTKLREESGLCHAPVKKDEKQDESESPLLSTGVMNAPQRISSPPRGSCKKPLVHLLFGPTIRPSRPSLPFKWVALDMCLAIQFSIMEEEIPFMRICVTTVSGFFCFVSHHPRLHSCNSSTYIYASVHAHALRSTKGLIP